MEIVHIKPKHGLGDVLTVLILLYNRSLENNWTIKVCGPEYITQLFALFDFSGLSHEIEITEILQSFEESNIISLLPKFCSGPLAGNVATVPFLRGKVIKWEIKNINSKPLMFVKLPKLKVSLQPKQDITYFQFDSRSICPLSENKTLLTEQQIRFVLNKLGKFRLIGIGGYDTKNYIKDIEYKLGNIEQITLNLSSCRHFIGADSGMSHVAGLLGVPGDVVLLHNNDKCIDELVYFYNFMYKSINVYKKSMLTIFN